MRRMDNRGFTLMEVLIVVAIIGVLASVAIPVLSDQYGRAREKVDLSNMETAYSLAQVEYMGELSGHAGPYYFNGTDLQYDTTGIIGYGQSTTSASEIAKDFPVQVTGTPNPTGNPEDARYLVVFCDENGISRVSWGGGALAGFQSFNLSEHQARAEDRNEALAHDVLVLNALEDIVQGMTVGDAKAWIKKYGLKGEQVSGSKLTGKYATCIQLAKCNVDPETHLPDSKKTAIYVPDVFERAGYDTYADDLYILESRDASNYSNGDIIWINFGVDINNVPDDTPLTEAFTYVKSNGNTTDLVLKDATRMDVTKR